MRESRRFLLRDRDIRAVENAGPETMLKLTGRPDDAVPRAQTGVAIRAFSKDSKRDSLIPEGAAIVMSSTFMTYEFVSVHI